VRPDGLDAGLRLIDMFVEGRRTGAAAIVPGATRNGNATARLPRWIRARRPFAGTAGATATAQQAAKP